MLLRATYRPTELPHKQEGLVATEPQNEVKK
jgi:hypothetical protein